jgi:hypothetical protein
MCYIKCQCFGVDTSFGFWLGLTTIFLKTYGEDTLQCSYKDYSSLDTW